MLLAIYHGAGAVIAYVSCFGLGLGCIYILGWAVKITFFE